MFRTVVSLSLLVLGLILTAMTGFSQASAAATPENAAAFIGDWTLSAEGGQGPMQSELSIKVDSGKVVGSLTSAGQASRSIKDISKDGKSLFLKYDMDYQGMAVPVVITLTPDGNKVALTMDFASGAYTMSGTAVKKK
jgi:hypothetical protein